MCGERRQRSTSQSDRHHKIANSEDGIAALALIAFIIPLLIYKLIEFFTLVVL